MWDTKDPSPPQKKESNQGELLVMIDCWISSLEAS